MGRPFGLGNTFGDSLFGLRIGYILYGSGWELTDVRLGEAYMLDYRALAGEFSFYK